MGRGGVHGLHLDGFGRGLPCGGLQQALLQAHRACRQDPRNGADLGEGGLGVGQIPG